MSNTPKTISELRLRIGRWLHLPEIDRDSIDFVLAVFKSNEMPGDPLWGLIIDASGGGKTEILRPLRKHPQSYFLSNLTEKTLISGYRDPKNPNEDPSLLPKLRGKTLIIKDLSPLLSMRPDKRAAILADLRDAYDGFTDQGKGNLGRVQYEGRFSVLAAGTLAIERFDSVDQELGERFVKFRMRSDQNGAKVRQAIRNVGRDDSLRGEIEADILAYLDSLPRCSEINPVSAHFERELTALSDFIATARSHVPRDHSHALCYMPRPEVGTRLGKELTKLFLALAVVRQKDRPGRAELRTVVRVAEDCLPPNRCAILRCLKHAAGPVRVAQVSQATKLPWSTAKDTLEDLCVLGVVERAGNVVSETAKDALWQFSARRKRQLAQLGCLFE